LAFAAGLTACLTPPTAPASQDDAPPKTTKTDVASDPAPKGRLPPIVVHRILYADPSIDACFRAGILRDSSLKGHVAVKFEVDRAGSVSWSKDVGSTVRDPNFTKCLVAAVGKLSFPPPDGGNATFTVGFDFSPKYSSP
jgi:TonB family protein